MIYFKPPEIIIKRLKRIELEEGDNYESVKQEWINECAKTINKLSKHTRGLKKLEAIAVKGNPQVNTSIEIIEK